ncbi:hypothetical protein J3F83DRAFT_749269 [Trichoderma novae-zelandiae]
MKIATGSGDKTVRIWDSHTNTLERTLVGHNSAVNSSAFSREYAWVVSKPKLTGEHGDSGTAPCVTRGALPAVGSRRGRRSHSGDCGTDVDRRVRTAGPSSADDHDVR